MGFFDKIRSGKFSFGKREPSMIVEFIFRDQKYILEELDLEFKQDLNDKNNPDSEPYGGLITITLCETPDQWINNWMMNVHEKRDGEFRFWVNDGKIAEGTRLKISFKDAYCVNYQKVMNPMEAGLLTTLTISPRYIKIGHEEFENRWLNS